MADDFSVKNPFPSGTPESKKWLASYRSYIDRLQVSETTSIITHPEWGSTGRRISTETGKRTSVGTGLPTGGPVHVPSEVKANYFFDQIRFGMSESTSKAMDKLGKSLRLSVILSMKPGKYRPYRSKRLSAFPGKLASPTLKGLIAETGMSRPEAKTVWRKTNLREAARIFRVGDFYHTGTFKNRLGERIGTRFQTLSSDSRGAIHWSSAPGKPPAPDTESLKKSVKYEIVQVKGGMFKLRLIADTPYARTMELGSASRGIAPRPYLRRAIEKSKYKKEFLNLMKLEWEQNKNIVLSENLFNEMKK